MSGFPEESLYIESADLETVSEQLRYLPFYSKSRYGGSIKRGREPVTLRGNTLEIFPGSSNGHQVYAIQVKKYPPRLGRTPNLQCPECKKWRKRLFLGIDVGTGSTSFHCRECMKDALL
jgi:hypothetical protein